MGYLFDLDKSRVCRILQKLEPILATVMAISKRKHLSKKDVECLIIDATEQPIERPKKGQKPFYSGKKKRHTIKTEIRINPKGRIVHVSKPKPGSVHDFELHKTEPPIPKETRAFVDSGYQGLDRLHPEIEVPLRLQRKNLLMERKKNTTQPFLAFVSKSRI